MLILRLHPVTIRKPCWKVIPYCTLGLKWFSVQSFFHFKSKPLISRCFSWRNVWVSVTMKKRNDWCFSVFEYCQNTGTRFSVRFSCSYILVSKCHVEREWRRVWKREREKRMISEWQKMFILPHWGIFQGFFDNASSCYSFKYMSDSCFICAVYIFFKDAIYICV